MTLTLKIILGIVISTIVGLLAFKVVDSATVVGPGGSGPQDVLRNSIGISGYVVSPGNYLLEDGATMGDLIKKAGGTTDKADSRAYLLDAPIEKNVQYYIPPRYNPNDICATEEIKKVNINSYNDKEALTFIDGIGTQISEAILNHRNVNGLFKTIEGLMNVEGIGNATYTKLRNYVILVD